MIAGILAVIIGYLLGSIPSAYIATRLAKGKDIRQLGGGNIGGLNTFREVGLWPAAAAGIVDLGKGAAAVVIALLALNSGIGTIMAVTDGKGVVIRKKRYKAISRLPAMTSAGK